MITYSRQIHPYHQVDNSPWPILMSISLLGFAIGLVSFQVTKKGAQVKPSQISILIISIQWWRDVIREAKGGYHTKLVQRGIQIGFLLFLISEIMIFGSLFWGFFHSSLAPAVDIGSTWPPIGINAVNTWAIPLLGTCVLLASGFILTLGHHATIAGKKYLAQISLIYTIILGIKFIYLQSNEYYYGEFTVSDSVYGTVFYLTTGLHGIHVIIGVIFLIIGTLRLSRDSFTTEHHQGFEFSILYWHQVDVVWQLVFLIFYWWGGNAAGPDKIIAQRRQ